MYLGKQTTTQLAPELSFLETLFFLPRPCSQFRSLNIRRLSIRFSLSLFLGRIPLPVREVVLNTIISNIVGRQTAESRSFEFPSRLSDETVVDARRLGQRKFIHIDNEGLGIFILG